MQKQFSRLKLAVPLLCIAALAGCLAKPSVFSYVAPVTGCCTRISEIQFVSMEPGREVDFSLTPRSPAFAFSETRQHFVAVKFPEGFNVTSVQVRSYLTTEMIPKATVVLPDFVFLDENKNVIGKTALKEAKSSGGFWRAEMTGRAAVPAKARYMIAVAGTGSGGSPVFATENGSRYSIPPAALGDFSMRLFGEATAK